MNLRKGLKLLLEKINTNKIIIKSRQRIYNCSNDTKGLLEHVL